MRTHSIYSAVGTDFFNKRKTEPKVCGGLLHSTAKLVQSGRLFFTTKQNLNRCVMCVLSCCRVVAAVVQSGETIIFNNQRKPNVKTTSSV